MSYHDPRVKLTMLFNMGIYQDNKRYLLKELKAPVAYFLGGTKDTGFPNVSSSPQPPKKVFKPPS